MNLRKRFKKLRVGITFLIMIVLNLSNSTLAANINRILQSDSDNKLVPHSISNLGFKVDVEGVKSTDSNIIKVKKLSCTINVKPITYPINKNDIFEKDEENVKASVGIITKKINYITGKETYEYNRELSHYCKSNIVGDEIKVTLDLEKILNGITNDFKLMVYIKTKPKETTYSGGDKLSFEVKDIQALTEYQSYTIDKNIGIMIPNKSIDKVISLPSEIIEAVWYNTPVIN